jgi:parallel beta-helix repeat protein
MATYYVKAIGGGTGAGTSYGTAWTYAHFKTQSLSNGDIVNFEGEFSGGFTLTNGVTYQKYSGASSNPIFSGFSPDLGSWTDEGDGVHSASLDVSVLNIVTLDGVVKFRGRFPRTSVLAYTAHNGDDDPFTLATEISTTGLASKPSFVGGKVHMRKYAWVWDAHVISAQSGTDIDFAVGTSGDGNNGYNPFNGNGYFVSDHVNTLDTFTGHTPVLGDWYYDNAANKLYMYFGGSPSGYTVKAATVNELFTITSKSNITFTNIDFQGCNKNAFNSEITTNINYTNCNFFAIGHNGLSGTAFGSGGENDDNTFDGCTFDYVLNSPILFHYNSNGCTVTNCTATNSSPFAGHTFPSDYTLGAFTIVGDNNTFTYNRIVDCGYHGIYYKGSGNISRHNYIEGYCSIKDDGGAVYTYEGVGAPTRTGNFVEYNRIKGSNGALLGKEGYGDSFGTAPCIYMDDYANGNTIRYNHCSDSTYAGIYMHNASDNTVNENICFNNQRGEYWQQNDAAGIRDNPHGWNRLIVRSSGQVCLELRSTVTEADMGLFFGATSNTSDLNEYLRPASLASTIIKIFNSGVTDTTMSLSTFATNYDQDGNSIDDPFVMVLKGNDFIKRAIEI